MLADFPSVFFQLCHGTNENPSIDKLSRAINQIRQDVWPSPGSPEGDKECLAVLPGFQDQNEIQVAANQSYFFKKFSMWKNKIFHFGTGNGEEQIRKPYIVTM